MIVIYWWGEGKGGVIGVGLKPLERGCSRNFPRRDPCGSWSRALRLLERFSLYIFHKLGGLHAITKNVRDSICMYFLCGFHKFVLLPDKLSRSLIYIKHMLGPWDMLVSALALGRKFLLDFSLRPLCRDEYFQQRSLQLCDYHDPQIHQKRDVLGLFRILVKSIDSRCHGLVCILHWFLCRTTFSSWNDVMKSLNGCSHWHWWGSCSLRSNTVSR